TMPYRHAQRAVAAFEAAKLKHGRHAERDRNDRRSEIPLVLVLMQRETRAHRITIDETSVGPKLRKPGARRRVLGEIAPARGHRRPALSTLRVGRSISVAGAVGYPAECSAIRHRNRHAETARSRHVTE